MKRRYLLPLATLAFAGVIAGFAGNALAFPTQASPCSSCHSKDAAVSVTLVQTANTGTSATYSITVSDPYGMNGWGVFSGGNKLAGAATTTDSFTVPVGATYTVFGVSGNGNGMQGYGSVSLSPVAPTPPVPPVVPPVPPVVVPPVPPVPPVVVPPVPPVPPVVPPVPPVVDPPVPPVPPVVVPPVVPPVPPVVVPPVPPVPPVVEPPVPPTPDATQTPVPGTHHDGEDGRGSSGERHNHHRTSWESDRSSRNQTGTVVPGVKLDD